ncbi:hypothetical protein NDU88_005877 [Pleurodeles waltl]|uniref:Uncharacterized protein n=1 Tax=Pleurodeles waltl TaxID=8319 RepID=A0AAV7PGT8_PLEWA|nr:hypothetical protein NDU88_005877 [Pleurodeles waltl]
MARAADSVAPRMRATKNKKKKKKKTRARHTRKLCAACARGPDCTSHLARQMRARMGGARPLSIRRGAAEHSTRGSCVPRVPEAQTA